MTFTEHWHDLVTASLLGTDRRDPPAPPPGPLADLVADTLAPTSSSRLLADVAATVAARRAGVRPAPPLPPPAPAPADDRPLLPARTVDAARAALGRWPILEDEWLLEVGTRRWRLPPDLLVSLLLRHRRDPARRAVVHQLAGPLGAWLVDHQPGLGPVATTPPPPARRDELPALAVAPELVDLLDAPAAPVRAVLVAGLADGTFVAAHRQVLVHFLARNRDDVLDELAAALRAVAADRPGAGLAASLADLATTRAALRRDLEPT